MPSTAEMEELKSMSLGDHLEELRARLILALLGFFAGLVVSLFFGKMFLRLLLKPFNYAMAKAGVEGTLLQAIDVAEPFMVYLKASMVLALLITSPWIIYQIWSFVSAGLYRNEKRFVYAVTPVSAVLFIVGTLFFTIFVAPLALVFFIKFSAGIDFTYQPSLTKYVNFVLTLSVVFGVAFQSPIAVVFAERLGLVSVQTLARNRKYVLIGVFFAAAVLTPPDVFSQVMLGIPLYILYEASIVICRLWRKKR